MAVARAGQLGRAAERLGVSNVTLSRHLAHLHSRVGSALFVRHSQGLNLTDEGHRLMRYLERAEAEIEAASEILEAQISKSVERYELPHLKDLPCGF